MAIGCPTATTTDAAGGAIARPARAVAAYDRCFLAILLTRASANGDLQSLRALAGAGMVRAEPVATPR